MYVTNVYGVMNSDCYSTRVCKYGLFNFEIPFFHLLMQ